MGERDRSYLNYSVVVFLTKGMTNCIKNQATDSSIKRHLIFDCTKEHDRRIGTNVS